MKPVSFFKEKSESLLKLISEIESNKIVVKEIEEMFSSKIKKQINELNEIKFQIIVMFTEFDNGKIFIDKLENTKDTHWKGFNIENYNQDYIDKLKNILKVFNDYLTEYRE